MPVKLYRACTEPEACFMILRMCPMENVDQHNGEEPRAGGQWMLMREWSGRREGRAGKQEANGHARDTHGAWCARETSCHSGQRHATAGDYEIKESRENGLLIYLSIWIDIQLRKKSEMYGRSWRRSRKVNAIFVKSH